MDEEIKERNQFFWLKYGFQCQTPAPLECPKRMCGGMVIKCFRPQGGAVYVCSECGILTRVKWFDLEKNGELIKAYVGKKCPID